MSSRDVRKVLGRKRTVEVLEYLAKSGVKNYTDIEEKIGASSDTITDSLEILTKFGLVERDKRSKKDVRYDITDKGQAVLDLVKEVESLLDGEQN